MRLISRFFRLFRIDYDKLHSSKTEGLFWMDVLMIILIIFNLGWVIFEFTFGYEAFRNFLHWLSPAFHDWYATVIHPNFLYYDLVFVAIFLIELFVRWAIAINRKSYEKWYYYPFIHWYDVLGCVPLSAFRALRLLRLFSMVYRLQRLGIIDLTSTFIYKRLNYFLGILTEEVSDRVVINVLNGVQDEVGRGSPIVEQVIRGVILPKQDIISKWMAHRMGHVGMMTFARNEEVVRRVIEESLAHAIRNNKEIGRLKFIPGAGQLITEILNKSVSDITFNTIKQSVAALSDPQTNTGLVTDASHFLMESLLTEHRDDDKSLDEFISLITVEILEVVKAEVAVRQWRKAEDERKLLREDPREI